jgi:hypothetical protein
MQQGSSLPGRIWYVSRYFKIDSATRRIVNTDPCLCFRKHNNWTEQLNGLRIVPRFHRCVFRHKDNQRCRLHSSNSLFHYSKDDLSIGSNSCGGLNSCSNISGSTLLGSGACNQADSCMEISGDCLHYDVNDNAYYYCVLKLIIS